jgi:sialate O-acetylesterase
LIPFIDFPNPFAGYRSHSNPFQRPALGIQPFLIKKHHDPRPSRAIFTLAELLTAIAGLALLATATAATTVAAAVRAEVTLAPLFTDSAVLQRGQPIAVWGTADAGENITVTFAGHSAITTADADGQWLLRLPALPASSESRQLVVQARQQNTITLNDIVVGEVWLASGQSNMEWIIRNTDTGKTETIFADNPFVRHYKTAKKVSATPLRTAKGAWERTTPATVGGFTALGYHFACELNRALGVPVGIINSSWGATPVEAWMDAETADAANGPAFAEIHTRWQQAIADYPVAKEHYDADLKAWEARRDAAKAAPGNKPFTLRRPDSPLRAGHRKQPGGLFNGMIAPHLPYALRGFVWYQGEGNTPRHFEYRQFQTALINGWRKQFAQGDLPFYWVQLANYKSDAADGTRYAFLREAQTQCLALPDTGQAVTIDIGNANNIHPRNKREAARRLALVALRRAYGHAGLVDSGPVFDSAIREGSAMRIHFKPADPPSPLDSPRGVTPSGFELAGADRIFHPAAARIEGDTILVTTDRVPHPQAVRYAWRNAPTAGLFNLDGLPACPFRSDDWQPKTTHDTPPASP